SARGQMRALWGRQSDEKKEALRRLAAVAGTWDPGSLVLIARALVQSGFKEEGAAVLLQGRQRHPGDFWVNFESSQTAHSLGRYDDAVRFGAVCVALRPDAATAHYNLATMLRKQGKPTEAAACL